MTRLRDAMARFFGVKARVEGLMIVAAALIFLFAGPVIETILCGIAALYGARKTVLG